MLESINLNSSKGFCIMEIVNGRAGRILMISSIRDDRWVIYCNYVIIKIN